MTIVAQLIGIIAMAANIASYQFKTKRTLLTVQLIGGALFAVNMFMLDATMGGLLNVLAVVRAFVYMHTERLKGKTAFINAAFILAYVLSYILVFTVFDKSPTAINFIIELLPLIGMTAMNIGFSKTDTKAIRRCGFICSPCWLIYNCFNLSIGGIMCETISLISILSAYLRLDVTKPKRAQK